jgi:F-type H+-transporting ATPase subunit delta
MARQLSFRYAKALLESARDCNCIDLVYQDMNAILGLFKHSQELSKVIHKAAQMREVADQACSQILASLKPSKVTADFLKLLIERNRFGLLYDISDIYIKETKKSRGIIQAKILTARNLDRGEQTNVENRLSELLKKPVDAEWLIDPSLYGGIRIQIGDNVYDGSLKARIHQIHKQLTQG